MKTIVVSAVNIRKGGTLTILRDCLSYLSSLAASGEYRIVALVHKRELAYFAGIEYIELPDSVKSWFNRLWCEYVTMKKLSAQIGNIDLWLSLHDSTPRVEAKRQAVYCQTSFPILNWKINDLRFDYKIVLFSIFTKYVYRFRCHKNHRMIVQTKWIRRSLSDMIGYPESGFIVAPPVTSAQPVINSHPSSLKYRFIYAATPDCHKNFELICQAAKMLAEEIGNNKFEVILTITGHENRYSSWLYKNWGDVAPLRFVGFMPKENLFELYATSDCLIFPSRVETWGLPISEYAGFNKPMLLANLPYSHETASGASRVAFFDPSDPQELKKQMKYLVSGDNSFLKSIEKQPDDKQTAHSWQQMFDLLLKD